MGFTASDRFGMNFVVLCAMIATIFNLDFLIGKRIDNIQLNTCTCQAENTVPDTVYVNDFDWNTFVEALIIVESGASVDAIGTKEDAGLLQIRPIYVAEANRIIGEDVYSDKDRFSALCSLEMFEVVQSYHNPDRCPHMALKLHNPKAPVSYHKRVMAEYDKLIAQRE